MSDKLRAALETVTQIRRDRQDLAELRVEVLVLRPKAERLAVVESELEQVRAELAESQTARETLGKELASARAELETALSELETLRTANVALETAVVREMATLGVELSDLPAISDKDPATKDADPKSEFMRRFEAAETLQEQVAIVTEAAAAGIRLTASAAK